MKNKKIDTISDEDLIDLIIMDRATDSQQLDFKNRMTVKAFQELYASIQETKSMSTKMAMIEKLKMLKKIDKDLNN